jgi:hypothetical protein
MWRVSWIALLLVGGLYGQTVPFVGCETLTQGRTDSAPAGSSFDLSAHPELAGQLAYYKALDGYGILGPRGWQCVAIAGVDSMRLLVMPEIDRTKLADGTLKITGPAILAETDGGLCEVCVTVPRMAVRLFPSEREWGTSVLRDKGDPNIAKGPYAADVIDRQDDKTTRFRTPENQDGFGTERFARGAQPINGLAMLLGGQSDGVLVQVRLPEAMRRLTTVILRQMQQEVESNLW